MAITDMNPHTRIANTTKTYAVLMQGRRWRVYSGTFRVAMRVATTATRCTLRPVTPKEPLMESPRSPIAAFTHMPMNMRTSLGSI